MKKIIYIVAGMSLLALSSCFKKDNYDEPNAQIHGNVIDFYTKQPLLTSQGDWNIRTWEKSWTESVAQFRDLPVKQDGTYNNSKQFAGTYDMLAYGGPFWPVADTAKGVAFNGSAQQDFTVVPYLQVTDLTTSLSGTNLTMTCRLKAPKRVGLPNLVEVKPYLSLTTFVGESNYINIPEYTNPRKTINQPWLTYFGDVETSPVITIGPLPVKSGYTYNVRIGANVNDAFKKYNYSEIKQVIVP